VESKVNYTIVGLFVVVLTTAMLSFAYWLTRSYGVEDYRIYHVHLSESVAGLNTDSSVKYRGVDVGTVSSMGINPDNPEEVRLVLKIDEGTRIKTDTRAMISFYGITGLAYVELMGSDKDAPVLTAKEGEIPVIPSAPSTFQRLDELLSQLGEKSARSLDNINRLLSDRNLENFEGLLIETKGLAADLRDQLGDLHKLIETGIVMENNIIDAARKVGEASTSIRQMSESIERSSSSLGDEASVGMRDSFTSLNQLLNDLDIMTESLQDAIDELRASPADMLFKRNQPMPGPGEEGYRDQ
jgi:phospholipid/cholesterol/gamma-HCH transport system substrate-binding protein